jgi:hypothetical protein
VSEEELALPARAKSPRGLSNKGLLGTTEEAAEKVVIWFQQRITGAKARRNFNDFWHD